ncbi:c-type cytochrome [Opitutales bacterium]|nr:c-type cytochrome [Opitutales bacterium]
MLKSFLSSLFIFSRLSGIFLSTTLFADPYAKSGNIKPSIVELSEEEEAKILSGVKVPDGFELTLYAPWQTANYPVYVAASPAGDLYVSSDGCGSLGKDKDRGRVLRLRDKDGDGRADEVTEFIPSLDSPRGLIWDQDRLYVLHPPHLSVYYDRDGDGVAEENKRLVDNIAFGFKDRPADHTTNGLDLGIDGWLYVSTGDFGFFEATGSDGRKLQVRGGGVIRVRTDGSGIELFSYGTRNILAVPTSPLLDLFGRDNTNDGGGWNVRFHHFSGLDDHGYPRLYLNFPEEIIAPLADYGGGSGCGGMYLHEPGFPEKWNHAPLTCDWGTSGLWKHTVERRGAGFVETAKPERFINVPRPTDADIDGMSRVYQASWKGPSSFNWKGPKHGYVIQTRPKDFSPEALPEFPKLTDPELVKIFEGESQVRALAAQRVLLRRKQSADTTALLQTVAADSSKAARTRALALFTLSQRGILSKNAAQVIEHLRPLASDLTLSALVMRALGDLGIDLRTSGKPGSAPVDLLIAGAESADPRTRLEAIVAATRQGLLEVAPAISSSLGHHDATLFHVAYRGLAQLGAHKPTLRVFTHKSSSSTQIRGASLALMRMHKKEVVDALLPILADRENLLFKPSFEILARLYHQEKPWDRKHWGGRPDTRGPYYEMVTWEQSERILTALRQALWKLSKDQVGEYLSLLGSNRIQDNETLNSLIESAKYDSSLIPVLSAQLSGLKDPPVNGLDVLAAAPAKDKMRGYDLSTIVKCLLNGKDLKYLSAIIDSIVAIEAQGNWTALRPAKDLYLKNNGRIDAYQAELAEIAKGEPKVRRTFWAYAGLMEITGRSNANAEAKASSKDLIESDWADPARRVVLINAAVDLKNRNYDEQIIQATADQDKAVRAAAQRALRHFKIDLNEVDATPKVSTLSLVDALAQVNATKGVPAHGEAIFTKAACNTCHTVSEGDPQKGPYLGNIAAIYPRNELAEAILNPGKSIAQGFATNLVTLKDGNAVMGFITSETTNQLIMRDMASQEHQIAKADITERTKMPNSMMPAGLMHNFSVKEFASLLDYIVGLSVKK